MVRQEGGPLGLRFEKNVSQALGSLAPREGLMAAWHGPHPTAHQPGGSSCFNPQPFGGEEPPFLEIRYHAGKDTGGLENTH